MKCKVLCIQTHPILFQKEENLNHMEELLRNAMQAYPDTQLVIFPELAVSGYQCGSRFSELAELVKEDSPSVGRMASLAREYGVFIIFGMPEKDPCYPQILYNAQILLDDHGALVGKYHKVHLFDSEKQWFTPGDSFLVFDTRIGRIGLFICYDAFFPEVARILAIQGVDLLVNCTNWEKPYAYDMDMVMAARALENTVYLACCNRIGQDLTLGFFGHSRILDPMGHTLTSLDEETEGFIYAELDYDKANQMKKDYYTMLEERQPKLYRKLVE